MKIYFTGNSNNKENERICHKIVSYLEKVGHEVFTELLGQYCLAINEKSSQEFKKWYKKWTTYIADSDLAIIEGSYPSTIHIGFEVGWLLSKGLPVILLYQQNKDPSFVSNFNSGRLIKSEYTEDNLESVLEWCLEGVGKIINRRFTFFISPQIDKFLEGIVKKKRITRSEYIRHLIEEKIKNGH